MKLFLLFLSLCCLSASATAQWIQKTGSEATTRHHPVTFTVGGDAYLLTGTTSQSSPMGTDDFYRYLPDSDSWEELPPFPGGARSYAYAGTYNDKAYFGFGTNNFSTFFKDLWEFDPATQEWTELTSCTCRGRTHPAFVVHDGKIFVGLGGSSIGDLNDWWEYDIAADAWTERPSLPGPARHHPFHFAAGDHVYAGFGHRGQNFYADWYQYDPISNSWTQMNNHPAGPRVAGQEFSHEGFGYVISGDGNNHANLSDGEFWRYEHETDTWTRLPDHPGNPPDGRVGRWAPGSFVLDGQVYFFGGVNRGGGFLYIDMWSFELETPVQTSAAVSRSIELFPNPASNTLHFSDELPHAAKWTVMIHDAQGKLVKMEEARSRQIGIAELPEGLYSLSLRSDSEERFTARFVVAR